MLKFTTMFPYIYLNGKDTLNLTKQDLKLSESKRIMGYLLKFVLKLTEKTSHFTSISEHTIFVYYEHPEVYLSATFPKIVSTKRPW